MSAQRQRLVLIVADDLGFVLWLGSKLQETGIGVLPAKEPSEAIQLLAQINRKPDLLVIHLTASDASRANQLIEGLPDMKVLALIGSDDQAYRMLSRVDAAVMRPYTVLEASVVLQTIERLLTRH